MVAYAAQTLKDLLNRSDDEVIARLIESDSISGFSQISHLQIDAWKGELAIFREAANVLCAKRPDLLGVSLVLEYRIPRREKRIDALLLLHNTVVVIEFKVGSRTVSVEDKAQVLDYALDLAYYHAESAGKKIVPLLCPTSLKGMGTEPTNLPGLVNDLVICGASSIADALELLASSDDSNGSPFIDGTEWTSSAYRPIPGIIEAAQALFARHSVEDIDTSLADDKSIGRSIAFVQGVIHQARQQKKKVLCLLTGVPGAGKTLTGLRLAHMKADDGIKWQSVFLSGNGPLLKVLKAALTQDYAKRQKVSKALAKSHAEALLHSVHSYLAEALAHGAAPAEQIVIFDEAQRAWDADKMEKMAKKARQAGFVAEAGGKRELGPSRSEPWQILSVLNHHADGTVVIALCGNGQEIHDGEAGVAEWVTARDNGFPDWMLICSPTAAALSGIAAGHPNTEISPEMHLEVSLRAHRGTKQTVWIDSVLEGDAESARRCLEQDRIPTLLTRDLDAAREWLLSTTAGTRRCGLLASSGGTRLRPYGIEVAADFRKSVDYAQWFTSPRGDLRSSFALEVAATEFECQGLELDRVCVAWSWDLIKADSDLSARTFRGTKWTALKGAREKQYVLNKYRVLLTRAREAMVIWVPKGRPEDSTRDQAEMDRLAEFLLACGALKL